MRKILFFLLLIAIIPFSIQSKEITDILGRKVQIPDKVERLIAIGPGALRLVTYISAIDKVVGVERVEKGGFTPYGRPYTLAIREKVKNLPLIGEGGPGKLPDFEAIVNLKPDIIIAVGFDNQTMDTISLKTKTPVIGLDYGSLGVLRMKKFLDSLYLASSILGKEKRAREIDEYLKRMEENLNLRTSQKTLRPKAYAGGIGFRGQHGITSTEAGFLPFKLVNVRNVVDGLGKDGHLFIEKEKLISLNPDIIFLDVNGLSIFEKELNDSPSLFMGLKAVKESKIFTILPYNYYNTNVELAISDALFVGKIAYPDSFADVRLDEEIDRIIRFFVSEPVYPEIKKNFGIFGKVSIEKGKIRVMPIE